MGFMALSILWTYFHISGVCNKCFILKKKCLKVYIDAPPCFSATSIKGEQELQIRILQRYFSLFLNENICCDPSLELS